MNDQMACILHAARGMMQSVFSVALPQPEYLVSEA